MILAAFGLIVLFVVIGGILVNGGLTFGRADEAGFMPGPPYRDDDDDEDHHTHHLGH